MSNAIEKEINALQQGVQRRAQSARTMFLLEYSPEQARTLLDQLHAAWYNGSPTPATAEEVYIVFRFYKGLSLLLTATYMPEDGAATGKRPMLLPSVKRRRQMGMMLAMLNGYNHEHNASLPGEPSTPLRLTIGATCSS